MKSTKKKKTKLTKYNDLCLAYGKAQEEFRLYHNGCLSICRDLVSELKSYFEIPESQFSIYQVTDENEFELVAPGLINAMSLKEDSCWHFGVGMTLCVNPETLPQELLLIHIALRKDIDNGYMVKYANHKQEFPITSDDKSSFIPFFDFLHESVMRVYSEQLHLFIEQYTKRKLGY